MPPDRLPHRAGLVLPSQTGQPASAYNPGMELVAVAAIDAGLVCILLGFLSVCKPLRVIGIGTRRRGWILVLAGFIAIAIGMNLPVRETRVAAIRTRLDEFAPVYQFHEWHTTTVNAPPDRVYAAMKAVEPDEIFGYRALTWIRRFGRSGKPNILNPTAHQPIMQTALQTGFMQLADDPGQEFVFGFGGSPMLVSKVTPANFKSLDGPFFAKVTMNFRIEPIDATHCTLTTETRVYGSDDDVQRFFAPYWRVIYPGSAFMRRMWLRAIRKRAESPDLHRAAEGPPYGRRQNARFARSVVIAIRSFVAR